MSSEDHLNSSSVRRLDQIFDQPNRCHWMQAVLDFLKEDQRLALGAFNVSDHPNNTRFTRSEVKLRVARSLGSDASKKLDTPVILKLHGAIAGHVLAKDAADRRANSLRQL
jgi:hypothetical protein